MREEAHIQQKFKTLVRHLSSVLHDHWWFGMIQDFLLKYFGATVAVILIIEPFFSGHLRSDSSTLGHAEMLSNLRYHTSVIVSLFQSLGTLFISARRLNRLSGYADRIHELMAVSRELSLENGKSSLQRRGSRSFISEANYIEFSGKGESDSLRKFPSKSCPLRYGTTKIQEDALTLFQAALCEFLGFCNSKTHGNENNNWGVTSLSVSTSKIVPIPSGTHSIVKYFGGQVPSSSSFNQLLGNAFDEAWVEEKTGGQIPASTVASVSIELFVPLLIQNFPILLQIRVGIEMQRKATLPSRDAKSGNANSMSKLLYWVDFAWPGSTTAFVEPDTEIYASMLDSLNECLQISGMLLDESQVRSIVDEIKQVITASSSRKRERAERTKAEDFDAEESELIKEENEQEEEVFDQVGEILGTLIKTFKASFLPFFDELLSYLTPLWHFDLGTRSYLKEGTRHLKRGELPFILNHNHSRGIIGA
ncbi:hypothetical protein HN873_070566, partial [Arachis hypogaea]